MPDKRRLKYGNTVLRYSAICSAYYADGEVILYDEKNASVLKNMPIAYASAANELMEFWRQNAPVHVRCSLLGNI